MKYYAQLGADTASKKLLGKVGHDIIFSQDLTATSNNFRGYGDGWIDYSIPSISGYKFVSGFIKSISITNSSSALSKMNIEVQMPVSGILRVLPVGDSKWNSGGNTATCTLTILFVKEYV